MHYTRRNFLRVTGALAGTSLLSWNDPLLKALFPVEGDMKLLRNNVGVYTERGGTIGWMIDKEGIIVVDTQFPEQAGHLIERIREKSGRRIDLVINSHHHGDHSSGNIAFKEVADLIVAHRNSRANQERVARERKVEDQQLYPGETFADTWSKTLGGETVTLRYFGPAHTNGDALIHFENANVVHMGDLVFNRRFPYIDRAAGASIQNWIQVLKKARKTFEKDTLYIFGHAQENYPITGTAADLEAMEGYLGALLKFMKKQIKKGMTPDQLKETVKTIPGAPQWQGGGIERSLQAAYEELTQ